MVKTFAFDSPEPLLDPPKPCSYKVVLIKEKREVDRNETHTQIMKNRPYA